jgi:hypothetical protein
MAEPLENRVHNAIAAVFFDHVDKHNGLIAGASDLQQRLTSRLVKVCDQAEDDKIIDAVAAFAVGVMNATKTDGTNKRNNERERASATRLLKLALRREPSIDEIDAVIPG